jgi:hypothetical protein
MPATASTYPLVRNLTTESPNEAGGRGTTALSSLLTIESTQHIQSFPSVTSSVSVSSGTYTAANVAVSDCGGYSGSCGA